LAVKTIIGLGNPGSRYEKTRHNVGFRVLDEIMAKNPGGWSVARENRMIVYTKSNFPALVKPQTYMNRSGEAVAEIVRRGSGVPELLVVSDEIQLAAGQIRLGSKGSDGGHNGLASVIDSLGTQDFERLRIGVKAASDPDRGDLVTLVLEDFPAEAEREVARAVVRAADAAMLWYREGVQAAMNKYNAKV